MLVSNLWLFTLQVSSPLCTAPVLKLPWFCPAELESRQCFYLALKNKCNYGTSTGGGCDTPYHTKAEINNYLIINLKKFQAQKNSTSTQSPRLQTFSCFSTVLGYRGMLFLLNIKRALPGFSREVFQINPLPLSPLASFRSLFYGYDEVI